MEAGPCPSWTTQQAKSLARLSPVSSTCFWGAGPIEIFAAYWPNQGDHPIAKAFNKATKYVVTRSLDRFDWEKSQRINGDVVEEIRQLKASDGPALHIWGSSELLQTLIAAELVDEYRIWVFPLVLGEGKRLFENGMPPRGLTLVETRSTPSGVLVNMYHPAGLLFTGSDERQVARDEQQQETLSEAEWPNEGPAANRRPVLQSDGAGKSA
jgi:dihydrofolate reductase